MMAEQAPANFASEIVEPDQTCSLEELCIACRVEKDWVFELVQYGVITPVAQGGTNLSFSHLTLVEVARAQRLRRDLDLNTPGLALALDLLEEIDELRARLSAAEQSTGTGSTGAG